MPPSAWPTRRLSRFLPIAALLLTWLFPALCAQAQTVIRGPYLQTGTHESIVIRWRTDLPTDTRVIYGTNLAILNLTAQFATLTNDHEIRLTGLQAETKYFYAIGTTTNILRGSNSAHYFVTAPPPGTARPTRIWVIGDAGTASAEQIAVRDAYATFAGDRPADLWLMLGDNAYEDGLDAEYQVAVFNVYTNQLRTSVLWPTLGNHDSGHSSVFTDSYPYFSMFTLPKNGEAGGVASGSEHYYSFNYGNIHFICLDSMTASRAPDGAMAMWLTNDLANVTADWTIAFWHHPPYSHGSHDSDYDTELVEMRQTFLPLLEQGGVDLVLSGHSHNYERSWLIDRHYGTSDTFADTNLLDGSIGSPDFGVAYQKATLGPAPHEGTVYAVVGCSGQTSGGALDHPAMCTSLNDLGSLVIDVTSNRLSARFIRSDGVAYDFFGIAKANTPPVTSNLTTTVAGDVASLLHLWSNDVDGDPVVVVPHSSPAHGTVEYNGPALYDLIYTPSHGYSGPDGFSFHVTDGSVASATATVTLNVVAPTDGNANGLPDSWETTYGITNPDADADGDGFSNRQEYWANSNPTNASSALRITQAFRDSNGRFRLLWNSVGGVRYRVSYSDGGANGLPGPFTDIVRSASFEQGFAPVGTPSTGSFTDDLLLTGGPPPHGTRFYRVHVIQ